MPAADGHERMSFGHPRYRFSDDSEMTGGYTNPYTTKDDAVLSCYDLLIVAARCNRTVNETFPPKLGFWYNSEFAMKAASSDARQTVGW